MFHVDRLRDTRLLVEIAGIRPQIRVICQPPDIALEMAHVHRVLFPRHRIKYLKSATV